MLMNLETDYSGLYYINSLNDKLSPFVIKGKNVYLQLANAYESDKNEDVDDIETQVRNVFESDIINWLRNIGYRNTDFLDDVRVRSVLHNIFYDAYVADAECVSFRLDLHMTVYIGWGTVDEGESRDLISLGVDGPLSSDDYMTIHELINFFESFESSDIFKQYGMYSDVEERNTHMYNMLDTMCACVRALGYHEFWVNSMFRYICAHRFLSLVDGSYFGMSICDMLEKLHITTEFGTWE